MTIIYYKRDGKIRHYQKAPDISRQQLELSVSAFNSRHESEGISSHLFDAPEGSFEAYILDVLYKNRFYTAESVQAAKDAIDQARDMIEALEPVEV